MSSKKQKVDQTNPQIPQHECFDDNDDDAYMSDEDSNIVFGITTVINLDSTNDIQVTQQIKNFLLVKAENNANHDVLLSFKNALQNESVGLLINERYVNIPPQITLPLFQSLKSEITVAISKKKPFDFKSIILISKFYRKEDSNGKVIEEILTNSEEEVFAPFTIASFDYCVKTEADTGLDGNWEEGDSVLIPYRKVSLINSSKLTNIIDSIKELLE
uniref:CSON002375 protein n=1 Tax=Culicoides sonorensis TaxID=179676 RepID=A0A336LRV7_CULSO